MPLTAVTVLAMSECARDQTGKVKRQVRSDHPASPSVSEADCAHRMRMDQLHAETMRGAKIGTALILGVIVMAGFCVAQLLGVFP